MKRLLYLIAIFSLALFNPNSTKAVSEFTTTFTSVYTIDKVGQTNVSHTITLKNNLAHIYATNYTIATTGNKLLHITASDESGPISSTTNEQGGNTSIELQISRPSIGKDQVKTLNINYQTDDVVEIIGDTITINIPRLARANEAESYTRVVKVAGVKYKPNLIFPAANNSETEDDYSIYKFEGHQSDSLTLLFGESVTYKLDLTYELKNKELGEGDSELALPPDTPYQKILLNSIVPSPKEIRIDESGNWLARYTLASQEKLMVQAEIYATVYPKPTLFDPSTHNFQKTSHSKYWDTTSTSIVDLAERLKSPSNIYTYLTSNFTYNYDGISAGAGRMGALQAINSPTNILCTEFTDVFVSLTRANNIPSREINGYGFTKNSNLQPQNSTADILHAWPEYYDTDTKTWISVDPTWGNTTGGIDYFNKLDFSHIAFVRHGLEDSYPLPAGSYKSVARDKHINVEVATEIPKQYLSHETRDNIFYNTGNVAIKNDQVGYVPPYGTYVLPSTKEASFYDKIRQICAKLLSIFSLQLPASM